MLLSAETQRLQAKVSTRLPHVQASTIQNINRKNSHIHQDPNHKIWGSQKPEKAIYIPHSFPTLTLEKRRNHIVEVEVTEHKNFETGAISKRNHLRVLKIEGCAKLVF